MYHNRIVGIAVAAALGFAPAEETELWGKVIKQANIEMQ